MPASGRDSPVFAHVHVYYHPAAQPTKYTGSIRIGFLAGSDPHEFRPDLTVNPGEPVGNQSVVGIVSDKPGVYAMAIDVIATSTPTGSKQPIQDQVRVVLK